MTAKLADADDTDATHLDRVRIEGTKGTIYTIRGELPVRFDGFRWQFVTKDHEHVMAATHGYQHAPVRAAGVRDGEIRARGIVGSRRQEHGLTEVLVCPP